jgi:hypothetical protein
MDNSQTSVKKDAGEDKPVKSDTHDDGSSGNYYYDDATGYETYDEKDDDIEDEEDCGSET